MIQYLFNAAELLAASGLSPAQPTTVYMYNQLAS